MGGETKKRLAMLVGCNYAGTDSELHGCINNVNAMRDTLVARFGFAPADVEVLTNERGTTVLPTGANFKRVLVDMVARVAPGDVLFFHFSAHGTLIHDDEVIVPFDFNLITDVDFRHLVDQVPPGASFTIVSNSCHSGGLIAHEKEQIGPSVLFDSGAPPATPARTTRFLPYGVLLDQLSGVSGLPSSHHVAD